MLSAEGETRPVQDDSTDQVISTLTDLDASMIYSRETRIQKSY